MEELKNRGKVLIVDDSELWVEFLEEILHQSCIQSMCARNGLEAVEFLKTNKFDLVITDTNMPYMDGFHLLKSIRASYPKLAVIVFFSGLAGSSITKEDVKKAGANAVLEKWKADRELMPVVMEILSLKIDFESGKDGSIQNRSG